MKWSGFKIGGLVTGLLVTGIFAAVFAAAHYDPESERPAYLLRYADNQPDGYPSTEGALYFAKLVEERTGGDVKIHVYGNEELGDEMEVTRQLQFGGIDFARVSTVQLIEHCERIAVLSLPYLYQDEDHLWRVIDGEIGDSFLGDIGDSGLIGLSWYDGGARNFYTSGKPIRRLEDLQGLTIRSQQVQYSEDMIRTLGAIPKQTPYSAVYSAISTGAVDGAENSWPSYIVREHYKVAKYVFEDEHVRIPEMQLMSEKTAEELPEAYLKIIRECARESAVYERGIWKEFEAGARARAIEAGAVVITLSDRERNRLREACQPLYERYGAGYEAMLAQIQTMGEYTNPSFRKYPER